MLIQCGSSNTRKFKFQSQKVQISEQKNKSKNKNVSSINIDTFHVLDQLHYMTKVNIKVDPEHEDLPSFYWLPKLHKNPYGKRFITESNRCITKSLSKLLTTFLAKITCHFREYSNGI